MPPDGSSPRSTSAWECRTVNMPAAEIVPSAARLIDCAEWVGGVEDFAVGLPQV